MLFAFADKKPNKSIEFAGNLFYGLDINARKSIFLTP